MAEGSVWCNMIYNTIFYLMIGIYFFNMTNDNTKITENAFHGIVITGLVSILQQLNRR